MNYVDITYTTVIVMTRISESLPLLFVTTTLSTGGAERMLLKILAHLDRTKYDPFVVSLLDSGTMGAAIKHLDIPVISLHMNSCQGIIGAPYRLARLIRQHRFAIIQGWMYHGNLLAWLGKVLAGSKAVLSFGIRQSMYGLEHERFNTRWVIRMNAWLSKYAKSCVFNSRFSLDTHRDFGFHSADMTVIANGFDLDAFYPDDDRGRVMRKQLRLTAEPIVGMVARFHPSKDHLSFLRAALIVRKTLPETQFVLVGPGVNYQNQELATWVKELCLEQSVLLLGERSDISDLNNLFDVACLSSRAEAFPNVVGEAMACGTPCVVTDVGDCPDIVGETGRIVHSGNPEAFADAILQLLGLPLEEYLNLGASARQRVVGRFDIKRIAQQYVEYFDLLLTK